MHLMFSPTPLDGVGILYGWHQMQRRVGKGRNLAMNNDCCSTTITESIAAEHSCGIAMKSHADSACDLIAFDLDGAMHRHANPPRDRAPLHFRGSPAPDINTIANLAVLEHAARAIKRDPAANLYSANTDSGAFPPCAHCNIAEHRLPVRWPHHLQKPEGANLRAGLEFQRPCPWFRLEVGLQADPDLLAASLLRQLNGLRHRGCLRRDDDLSSGHVRQKSRPSNFGR
mmetsp:Transcript_5688/g.15585  ORF Transcript_5688/g.15585 Transcript_5688/m.15585 type:complete len:228 (+) Transcript_5688:441-1124(+)